LARFHPESIALVLIVLATWAAYSNSLHGPFILDDEYNILTNPSIRNLTDLPAVLSPPNHGETVTGRPLLNLSLAINFAISGSEVRGYHITNLVIHILGALLLFGILHRTFLMPSMRDAWAVHATWLALVIALLWAVHPLQTESVTYIVQRAESLVGLFYLLTLYCVLRGAQLADGLKNGLTDGLTDDHANGFDGTKTAKNAVSPTLWYVAAVAACLLGMASKEVMVSVPVVILLYDRAFMAGSFREAWRRRKTLYLALACTWVLLAWLIVQSHGRGGSAGFGTEISSGAYLCTQFGAITHYLRLCVWPYPLVLDYGSVTAQNATEIVPYAFIVGGLGVGTVVALWRWPKVGFLGVWFFAILAPSSSIVPVVTQTIAEHRMYLPLAAVMTSLTLLFFAGGRFLVRRGVFSQETLSWCGACVAACVVFGLAGMTFHRNQDYRNELAIWQDVVEKLPCHARALVNLGNALVRSQRPDEAIPYIERSLAIHENAVEAHVALGAAKAAAGRVHESIPHYQRALELNPKFAPACNNLGLALAHEGRWKEAAEWFERAADANPYDGDAYYHLGNAWLRLGQPEKGLAYLQKALELEPQKASIYNDIGSALARKGQIDEAMRYFRQAIAVRPDLPEGYNNLGMALASTGHSKDALTQYAKALEVQPNFAYACANMAWLKATSSDAAVRDGEEAVRLAEHAVQASREKNVNLLDTLAAAYAEAGQFADAVRTEQQAIALALEQNNAGMASGLKARLELYESGKPYRER
jgi:tetratricopeptide (TPR) repeat protein